MPPSKRATTVPQLSQMDLRTTEDLAIYLASARAMLHDLAVELDTTTAELQKKLQLAHMGRDRFQHRMAVRRMLRPLRQAAGHTAAASHGCSRTWRNYVHEFAELVNPARAPRSGWRYADGNGNANADAAG